MDFDLNFGRFFGLEIDSFRKAESSENVPPQQIWTPKIVIFSRGNAIFYKIHDFALKWKSLKNAKHIRRKRIKINLFFNIDFSTILEPTWLDFGLQVGAQQVYGTQSFSQVASKRRPRAPKSAQEAPKRRPRGSKSTQRGPKRVPTQDFTRFWRSFWQASGSIFGVFSCFFLMFLGFRSCMCPVSFASLLSLPFRLGGDIPRQSPPLVWHGRLSLQTPPSQIPQPHPSWIYFQIIKKF